jgi:pimeloyl-ACP methyl ester carboxylesterase
VLVAGAVAIAALHAAPAAGAVAGPNLAWHGCGDGFQCATLTVPLDSTAGASPGPTVDLAVVRRRARHPDERIGSLVVNPGGPGVPAIGYLRSAVESFPAVVQDRFDLVAFDPRGVGESDPIDCVPSLDPLFDEAFSPSSPAERASLTAAFEQVATACAAHDQQLLPHVSTDDTARDLERLRVALGDRTLSFLGFSYATYLGARYASIHPDHVRGFVLDGAIDPALGARESVLQQVQGFEGALDDFLADCSAHPQCAFHHDGHAAAAYDDLRARAARSPLAVAHQTRTLNQTRFDAAIVQDLYLGRSEWPSLARALRAADDGDASALLALADAFVGRGLTGADDGSLEAFWAIGCRDGPTLGDLAATRAVEADAARAAPRVGAFIVNNSLACSVWPVAPVAPDRAPTAAGAPPILVIGTTRDPATPLAQARSLARELGSGALLVVGGERHTAFLSGNACVDRAVSDYLVAGTVPRSGTRC